MRGGTGVGKRTPWALLVLGLVAPMAGCKDHVLIWKYEGQSPSYSTPLVTPSFVAFGNDAGVTLLELDGEFKCSFDARGAVVSAPKTDGHLIFFGSTNYVMYAIDTGCQAVWKYATQDHIKSDPLLANGQVYFASYDGHVYAADAATGALAWQFPALKAKPLAFEDEPEAPPTPQKALRGKHKRKAKALLHAEAGPPPAAPAPRPPPAAPGAFAYSSPVLAAGVIYVGNLDHYLYAINAADGTLRWRFETQGAVTSTPVVVNDVVYFGSNDGHMYAVRITDQYLLWKTPTMDWVSSSARPADGLLYFGSNDAHVYAVDAARGETKWKLDTKGPVVGIPALYKNDVIAVGGNGDNNVYAIRRSDHAVVWKYTTEGKIESDPVVVDNRLYVTSGDRFLYVFNLAHMGQH